MVNTDIWLTVSEAKINGDYRKFISTECRHCIQKAKVVFSDNMVNLKVYLKVPAVSVVSLAIQLWDIKCDFNGNNRVISGYFTLKISSLGNLLQKAGFSFYEPTVGKLVKQNNINYITVSKNRFKFDLEILPFRDKVPKFLKIESIKV